MESPDHYGNNWDVGDFIREQGLNFHLGNAIKYICRAGLKGSKVDDLNKAIHYLENELQHSEPTRSSGGIPFSLLSNDDWIDGKTYPEGFDR